MGHDSQSCVSSHFVRAPKESCFTLQLKKLRLKSILLLHKFAFLTTADLGCVLWRTLQMVAACSLITGLLGHPMILVVLKHNNQKNLLI